MLDFLVIATRSGKRGIIEIYPKFIIKKSSDLMIRGGDFYAIWIEERGLWSTDEQDAVDLIDRELDRYAEENCKRFDDNYRVMHMRNGTASSQVISHFLKLGSTRAQIEKELLEKQRDLAAAKAEAIESSAKMEDLYLKAAKAMKSYQGQEDEEDEY